MKAGMMLASALALVIGAVGCSDSTDPDESRPRVESIGAASAPTAPAGTIARCYTGADGQTVSANCPVIRWGDVTYWVFAYVDEGINSLLLVAYDEDENILFQSERTGTRQLYQITVNDNEQVVTLFGLGSLPSTIPWSVLDVSGQ